MVGLDPQNRVEQCLRQHAKPHPHTGRERLAVRARIDHPLRRATDRQCGRRRFPCKTKLAIRRILQQVDRMPGRALVFSQQLNRSLLDRKPGRAAGRVLVVRHEVQHLHPLQLARAAERLQHLLEVAEIYTVAVHPHAAPGQPAALHDAEVNKISRILHQHDVAGVAQRLGQKIQKLLRTVGDDQALGQAGRLTGRCAIEFRDAPGGAFDQRVVARGGAVLQRRLAKRPVTEQFIHQAPAPGQRQRLVVGEAGRKRDQFRPLQLDPHQPRDWRSGRPPAKL